MALTKNIVTDYGCPINGTSDCRAAFVAFKADAQGLDADLTIPAHTYQFLNNSGSNDDFYIFEGIKSLVVHATGATFSNGDGSSGTGIQLGTRGLFQDNTHHARIATALAGTTTISVTDGNVSRFTSGRYIMVTALDLQGAGYPLNPYYFEYALVSNISGTTITLAAPLANSYLSTFPQYDPGSAGQIDQGGPATIYALPQSWGDANFEFIGLTASQVGQQTYANGRSIKFTDCICTESAGIVPTQNQSHTWSGCDFSACAVELDKCVSLFTVGNGTSVGQLDYQSSSITRTVSTGGLTLGSTVGTGQKMDLDGVTGGTLSIGPHAYGVADYCNVSNSTLTGVSSITVEEIDITNVSQARVYAPGAFSMSGGVISLPLTCGPVRWAVPGKRMFFVGKYETETAFTIVSVTTDGSNTLIQTSLSGGFPAVERATGSRLDIMAHPGIVSISNCVGCDDAIDLSQAGAQGRGLWEYSNRTYNKSIGSAQAPSHQAWGNLAALKVNVVTPYTGTQGTLSLHVIGEFDNYPTINLADYSTVTYGPVINVKVAGERIITPSGVTGTQSGDSGLTTAPAWFTGLVAPKLSVDVSGESAGPVFTIEYITDQGFPNAMSVVPLRLRLHA